MIPQYDHNVKASFGLWLDNFLFRKGESYTNAAYSMTKINGTLNGYNVFKSPHSQWVYDAGITGAQIPTGVWINGTFQAEDKNNIFLDFNEGRVFVKPNISATQVSGQYAFKEINLYFNSQKEEDLLFNSSFSPNPRTKAIVPTGMSQHTYPAIYIQYGAGNNQPFAFGGLDSTTIRIRTIALTDSQYLFEGICGILRDSERSVIGYLEGAELPFNAFGGLKSGLSTYNYIEQIKNKTSGGDAALMTIVRVAVSPFNAEVNEAIGSKVVGGFIDFDISTLRYPRGQF